MQNGTQLAAIDLGSNSFRLEIGVLDHGLIRRTQYLKETVRQGNGLDEDGHLSAQAMERGWDCLARFGERLSGFKKNQVRAVATQTLREARNRDVFLKRAQELLGFHIDVIPGREEARLIYQGVARLLPQSTERRLVIDIGGRSTEMVLGQQFQAHALESWPVGSVTWSMNYFAQGLFTPAAFKAAEVAAKAVLEDAVSAFHSRLWDSAYGSSGTVGAVSDILTAAGWPAGVITRESLDWLVDRLLKAQSADKLKFEGLKEDRRAVVGGGVSVLRAVMDLLDISSLNTAQGALRHGVLYDLLDREHDTTDLRSQTVQSLTQKFTVDRPQSQRVGRVARYLMPMLHQGSAISLQRSLRKLDWAAQLHEIGSHISHQEPHRHGAYILAHADAPGFSMDELQRLSLLVLGHRGKLRKLEADFEDTGFVQQLLVLRLSVILCHARRDPEHQDLRLRQDGKNFELTHSQHWAARFPQSAHLLREEALAWQKTPCALRLNLA